MCNKGKANVTTNGIITNFGVMSIHFFYADKKLPSTINKTSLKQMVSFIFKNERKVFKSIDYIFCSDTYLLELNRTMLNHDYYTDIITFPLHEKNQPIEAEIYISIDRVKENATLQKVLFKAELARVVAHGALHLCGYKDKLKKDIAEMRAKEDEYSNAFV